MTVKEFANLLEGLKYADDLIIIQGNEVVWENCPKDYQIYKYLFDKKVSEMWLGTDGLCIRIN